MKTIENYFSHWRENETMVGKIAKTQEFLSANEKDRAELMRKTLPKELQKYQHINFWVDVIVRPLASDIKEALGYSHVEVLGPFGIDSNVALHFFNGKPENDVSDMPIDQCVASITLSCDLNANLSCNEVVMQKIDHNTSSNEYPKGSIGSLNGLNKNRISIPNDATGEQFKEFLDI